LCIADAPEAEHRRCANGGSCPNHRDDADTSASSPSGINRYATCGGYCNIGTERIYALVTTGDPVDVVVWRHPAETADEAIERYRRQHPAIATMPSSTTIVRVVSWEGRLEIFTPWLRDAEHPSFS
jgi:hypothetical protein